MDAEETVKRAARVAENVEAAATFWSKAMANGCSHHPTTDDWLCLMAAYGQECYERGQAAGGTEKLKLLTGAMKKVLPSVLLQEVMDHCDPLGAFLREIGEGDYE